MNQTAEWINPNLFPIEAGDIARFRAQFQSDPASGCWFWKGRGEATNYKSRDYGKFWFNGRLMGAHQFAYRAFVGPIPEGMELDHLCRNPLCCNPAHLEPVTRLVNQRRAAEANRKDVCGYGHAFDAENTIVRKNGRRRCRACNRKFQREWLRNKKAQAG